jgi:hypothetical protein
MHRPHYFVFLTHSQIYIIMTEECGIIVKEYRSNLDCFQYETFVITKYMLF